MTGQETIKDVAVTVKHRSLSYDTDEFYTTDGNIVAKKSRDGDGSSISSVFYGRINELNLSQQCAKELYEFLKKRDAQSLKGEDWIYISGLERLEREHLSALNSEEDRFRNKLYIHRNFAR